MVFGKNKWAKINGQKRLLMLAVLVGDGGGAFDLKLFISLTL
jgi:hypothetical protein